VLVRSGKKYKRCHGKQERGMDAELNPKELLNRTIELKEHL
jgi:hypothetical protein